MEEYDKEITTELEKNIKGISDLIGVWESFDQTELPGKITLLMRYAHSIKSVGSFIGNDRLQSEAHSLEDKIASFDKPEKFPEITEEIETFLQKINDIIDFPLSPEWIETDSAHNRKENSGKENTEKEKAEFDSFSDYSPLYEKNLLERAFRRGEKLYRMDYLQDPSEALPYARAYLINRNLEQTATVLRTSPSLKYKSADFSRFILIFSADRNKNEILKSLQTDFPGNISLEKLDFSSYLPGSPLLSEETASPDENENEFVSVSAERVKEIEVCLEELISLNEEIELSEPIQYRKIKNILDNMEGIVSGLVSVDLRILLGDWHRFVSDVGNRLSKQVSLNLRCEKISLSKSRAAHMESILRQLIHNSVSHGIETPDVRIEKEKSPEAKIDIICRSERGNLIIDYRDDGSGIEEETLINRAKESGLYDSENELSLLEILAIPGLTTKKSADLISGRGAGMDIVLSVVRESLGGSIRLVNNPGKGVQFNITFPIKDTSCEVLIFRSENDFFSLPKNSIERTFSIDLRNIEEDSPGRFFYWIGDQKFPLFKEDKRIEQNPGNNKFGILVRNGLKRGVVIADDLVMEKMLEREGLISDREKESGIIEILDSNNSFGYKFLSPLIIQ